MPTLTTARQIVLRDKPSDSRGVLATYISQVAFASVQSNLDSLFYFRNGDEFVVAPYGLVRRLFASSDTPDLHVMLEPALVKKRDDGSWDIPLPTVNLSNAKADHVKLFVLVHNPDACETITAAGLRDVSEVNPGRKVFASNVADVIHRGLNELTGHSW